MTRDQRPREGAAGGDDPDRVPQGPRSGPTPTDPHREHLLEQVIGAWRPRDREGAVTGHPVWFDLTAEEQQQVFADTVQARRMEAALDPHGLSGTARAVLRRVNERRDHVSGE